MTDTIFPTDQDGKPAGDKTPATTEASAAPTIPTELQELVGVGKKYLTLEDAYKSVPHAQNHISTLEADIATQKATNEALQAELLKRKTAEELLADIKQSTNTSTTNATVDATPDVLSEAVRNELARQAQADATTNAENQRKANQKIVVETFKAQYGDKAEEFYAAVAKNSSMSIADINTLAASSPDAVLKLAGIALKPVDNSGGLDTTINTQALNNGSTDTDLGIRLGKNTSSKDLSKAWANTRAAVNKDLGIT